MIDQVMSDELLVGFSRQRQILLRHAAELASDQASAADKELSVSKRTMELTALLVSSLEVLKVAEEELVERTMTLTELRDAVEAQTRDAMALFELAPACLIVTDCNGSIVEANRMALSLFRQSFASLQRQPISRFIQQRDRRDFRQALARVVATESVEGWRFVMSRLTDAPVPVIATVHAIKGSGDGGATRLYWRLDVLRDDQPSSQ